MIISIVNQKGGCGKSTIACNLAVAMALDGVNCCLIDADKQATSTGFRQFRKANTKAAQFPIYQLTTDTIEDDVPKLKFATSIIDVGGRDISIFRGAIGCSDIVLVPVQPSAPDIWSTEATLQIVKESMKFHKDLKVFGVLNLVNHVAKSTKEMDGLIRDLQSAYPVKFLTARLAARIQYQYAMEQGLGILEQTNDMKAREEFAAFFRELKEAACLSD